MQQLGYEGLYKQKTRASMGPTGRVDGCALFYKVAKFELKEKYVIEFNDAARVSARQGHFSGVSVEEAENPNFNRGDKSTGLARVTKDNVAQIAVLEIRDVYGHYNYMEHPPRICVSNVHIFWDPAFADVKLWQTQMLLQETERIMTQIGGSTQTVPLVIAGDFNSEMRRGAC